MSKPALGAWTRRMLTRPRLLLAGKTALAAAIAWLLAPLMPFTDAHYSYYAPLGAVVSMYPTFFWSVRSGAQALLGLALGAGLAFGVLAIGGPRVIGVVLVVGVGVLIAGIRRLGEGRNWVPITALFVLLIGGPNADDYSSNYLIHMLLGVAVGLLVTVVVVPPLYLRDATARLDSLRDMVADHLRTVAAFLTGDTHSDRDWSRSAAELEDTARDVREAVKQANESRRGNPRGRRVGNQVIEHYRRLRALEHVVFLVRDLTEFLVGFSGSEDHDLVGLEATRQQLAAAIVAVAALVGSEVHGNDSRAHLDRSQAALQAVGRRLDDHAEGRPTAVADAAAPTMCLRGIIDAARPFVSDAAADSDPHAEAPR